MRTLILFIAWLIGVLNQNPAPAEPRRAPVQPTPADAAELTKTFYAITLGRPFISFQVQRANQPLDWRSPASIAGSALFSGIDSEIKTYKHAIGHATLVFGSGGVVTGLGQTGDYAGKDVDLIRAGFGFRALTQVQFLDGFLQDSAVVQLSNAQASAQQDKFAWMLFLVNQQTVDRVNDFVQRYRSAGADRSYGFAADPLQFQGGGCTSFVNALMKIAGLDFPALDRWVRQVLIPDDLLGFNAEVLAGDDQLAWVGATPLDRFVQPLAVFSRHAWAHEREDHEMFRFFDPDYFYFVAHQLVARQTQATLDKTPPELHELWTDLEAWRQQNEKTISVRQLYGTPGLVIEQAL